MNLLRIETTFKCPVRFVNGVTALKPPNLCGLCIDWVKTPTTEELAEERRHAALSDIMDSVKAFGMRMMNLFHFC